MKEIKWYEESGHVITLDKERDQLHEDIYAFLEKLDWQELITLKEGFYWKIIFNCMLISLLQYMKDEAYKPLTVQELEAAFGIADSSDFKEFVKALVQMEEKGLSCPDTQQPLRLAAKNESYSWEINRSCERICVCYS